MCFLGLEGGDIMRKTLTILALVFAFAFAFGAMTPSSADAAGGSGGNCYYTCTCAGVPLYCCVSNGKTSCKVTDVFQCTQGYNC